MSFPASTAFNQFVGRSANVSSSTIVRWPSPRKHAAKYVGNATVIDIQTEGNHCGRPQWPRRTVLGMGRPSEPPVQQRYKGVHRLWIAHKQILVTRAVELQ